MNKILLLTFLASVAFLKAQEPRKHDATYIYVFHKVFFHIANNYITSKSNKYILEAKHLPFKEQTLTIYGSKLRLGIEVLDSDPLAKSSGNVLFTWPLPTHSNISGGLIDTVRADELYFHPDDLQVRVFLNGEERRPWTNISDLTAKNQLHIIFEDSVPANTTVITELRNTRLHRSLSKWIIKRDSLPVEPLLFVSMSDTSPTTPVSDFVQRSLSFWGKNHAKVDSFYHNWPKLYAGKLTNQEVYETTKMALFFRKFDFHYPDSSLEYKIISNENDAMPWKISGHIIFITSLHSNTHYSLLVRYNSNPENVSTYTFFVAPKWYQRTSYRILIIGMCIIMCLVFFLFKSRQRLHRIQAKEERLALEVKSTRSQLNPHFIFNALASIQGLINKNEINSANHYLTEFSKLLRESLRNNNREMVPLTTEIQLLENYLKLEQLRFHFQYSIKVDELINQNAIETPPLLLQPLVENAVKHGVASLQEKGIIVIRFALANRDLEIFIDDNGSGYDGQISEDGIGLKLTRDRVQLLNERSQKQQIEIHFKNRANAGTTVHLSFKNWL